MQIEMEERAAATEAVLAKKKRFDPGIFHRVVDLFVSILDIMSEELAWKIHQE